MREVCGVQLKHINRAKDLVLMLDLNETMDQLDMANSVRWYGYVSRREDGQVLRRTLDFEVEGEGRKAGIRGHGRSRLKKKV